MNRKLALLVAALVSASFMGCQLIDSLFFNTEEVKASELATFTGSTPTTKNEALMSAMVGISTTYGSMMTVSLSEQAPAALAKIFPAIKGSEAAFNGARAIARTISPSTGFESFIESVDTSGAGMATVKFIDEDFDSDGTIVVNGEITLEVDGIQEGSTEASGKAEAEFSVEVKAIADTPFNGAMANLKLNANADSTMTTDGVPETISGYAALALSAGISLDEIEGTSKGGKFVIAIKYTSNFEYDASISETDPTGGVSVEINLKVYDASNRNVGDYTYNEDEIMAFLEGA